MKSFKSALIASAVIVAATTLSHAATMNAAQLKSDFVGHSYNFKSKKGATGSIRWFKNGKSSLSKTNFSVKKDSGTWKIKGNKLCNRWKKIRSGKEKCFVMEKIGTNKFRDSSGNVLTRK